MGLKYDEYLRNHVLCVEYGLNWILSNVDVDILQIILPKLRRDKLFDQIVNHDFSKNSDFEYNAYDEYFYGDRTPEVERNFDYAWLHHLHNNPHHWQYWILKEDDSIANGTLMEVKALDMPDNYILEMIADWWSFSWKTYLLTKDKNDLYEIFNWYNDHIDKIVLSKDTKLKVESILKNIKNTLDSYNHNILPMSTIH